MKFAGTYTAWKTVKNASPNQWSSALTYDSGWVTVSQAAANESFAASVCMDSSSNSRTVEYGGTVKIKKGNTLPYWPSGTTARLNGTTGATTVAENVTSVNYAWDAAKDD
ncbi:MAG: hypothetical protein LIO46_06350, partial [Clostridiales bacterium]|nr:hypothetical protein [Clostridiales bacterium]